MATPDVYKYRLQIQDRETGEKSMIYRLSIFDAEKCVEIFKKYQHHWFTVLAIFKYKGTY